VEKSGHGRFEGAVPVLSERKILSQDYRLPDRDCNPGPPEYEAAAT
jgi:hypothetical protein